MITCRVSVESGRSSGITAPRRPRAHNPVATQKRAFGDGIDLACDKSAKAIIGAVEPDEGDLAILEPVPAIGIEIVGVISFGPAQGLALDVAFVVKCEAGLGAHEELDRHHKQRIREVKMGAALVGGVGLAIGPEPRKAHILLNAVELWKEVLRPVILPFDLVRERIGRIFPNRVDQLGDHTATEPFLVGKRRIGRSGRKRHPRVIQEKRCRVSRRGGGLARNQYRRPDRDAKRAALGSILIGLVDQRPFLIGAIDLLGEGEKAIPFLHLIGRTADSLCLGQARCAQPEGKGDSVPHH
jgi:hypothetical protein